MENTEPGRQPGKDVTLLLQDWRGGSKKALDELMPLVYEELCIIARSRLKNEKRPFHTLRTDALVNEAYIRLCSQKDINFQNRTHFFGIAARIMRQILVDYARGHHAEKRGGQVERAYSEDVEALSRERARELVRLDSALEALEQFDKQKAHIVEVRYFGGLTIEEAAEVLEMSPASLKREWTIARAWLMKCLNTDLP